MPPSDSNETKVIRREDVATTTDAGDVTPKPTANDTRNPTATGASGFSRVGGIALFLGLLGSCLVWGFTLLAPGVIAFIGLPVALIGLVMGFMALGRPGARGAGIGAIALSLVALAGSILNLLILVGVVAMGAKFDEKAAVEQYGDTPGEGVPAEVFRRDEDEPVDYDDGGGLSPPVR